MKEIEDKILELCHNGTHSCKIYDILSATGLSKLELWEILKKTQIKWQISENINGIKLLVLQQ